MTTGRNVGEAQTRSGLFQCRRGPSQRRPGTPVGDIRIGFELGCKLGQSPGDTRWPGYLSKADWYTPRGYLQPVACQGLDIGVSPTAAANAWRNSPVSPSTGETSDQILGQTAPRH